ncbi:MAG: hypothetical protein N2511_08375, partial [Thermodesulfovibrionales bacterium]|nr:hypothetical protein [Thermodesulfovibrionales bacterium]
EDGNIIRISPIDAYLIELALEKRVTKVYKLKYVRPSDIIQRTKEIRTILAESRIFQFIDIDTIKLQEQADKLEIFFPYKVSELKRSAPTDDMTFSYDTAYKGLEESRTVSTVTKEGTSEAKEGSLTFKNKSVATKREEKYTKMAGIAVDERTGSLIINAPNSVHSVIQDIIAKLDVPQKQVLFETRIIELNSSFSKSLGFEWGISWILPGSKTNIVGSLSGNVSGGSTPLAINLPAKTSYAAIPQSAITVGYLNASGTFALDLRISALQQTGKAKVIANPRIIGIDNQVASITQGQAIPYPFVTIEQGVPLVTAAFKDIGIKLALTPRVIDDEKMNIYIAFEKEEFVDFLDISKDIKAPITAKVSESTEVQIKNGETIVLGGIYRKTENISSSKVPGLGDIPIVGELFKSRGRDENINEVLIFITPRIISSNE